jgi:hypothetical protein
MKHHLNKVVQHHYAQAHPCKAAHAQTLYSSSSPHCLETYCTINNFLFINLWHVLEQVGSGNEYEIEHGVLYPSGDFLLLQLLEIELGKTVKPVRKLFTTQT